MGRNAAPRPTEEFPYGQLIGGGPKLPQATWTEGSADASQWNARMEFQRNRERYMLLRWGQQAFRGFRVVPPDTGIVHQINLEYLASVVFRAEADGGAVA